MQEVESLVALVRAADSGLTQRHDAYGQLVARFQDMAYGCAYAILGETYLAQAAAQDAFIAAYESLGQLREPAAFPGWLRRIVVSQCSRILRQEQTQTQPIDALTDLASNEPDPAEVAENRELRDQVLRLVQALPEHQRTAVVLYYVNEYSQREVADFLEVPVTTVKQWLQRARRRLRERMISMVQHSIQEGRPSSDDRFLQVVQLATELEGAASDGELATLEMLLLDGIDVNLRGRDGRTLLHYAAQNGRLEMIELLIKCGADVTLRDRTGRTPLQVAQRAGRQEVIDRLKLMGAEE
jgi:RNA polymerase sigma factor (sigma-70 family)